MVISAGLHKQVGVIFITRLLAFHILLFVVVYQPPELRITCSSLDAGRIMRLRVFSGRWMHSAFVQLVIASIMLVLIANIGSRNIKHSGNSKVRSQSSHPYRIAIYRAIRLLILTDRRSLIDCFQSFGFHWRTDSVS